MCFLQKKSIFIFFLNLASFTVILALSCRYSMLGRQFSGQFCDSLAPACALVLNPSVWLSDGNRAIVVALWVALDHHTVDEHCFYYAHNSGFIASADVC